MASAVPQAPPPMIAKRFTGSRPTPTAHPFTPAPGRGGASLSSGQRGLIGASRQSAKPSRSRSMPAQAIMAPLSVHNSGGGATKRSPTSSARSVRRLLSLLLAATPPLTTSETPLGYLQRNHATAFA